jgi:hypothetical protein
MMLIIPGNFMCCFNLHKAIIRIASTMPFNKMIISNDKIQLMFIEIKYKNKMDNKHNQIMKVIPIENKMSTNIIAAFFKE